MSLKKIHSLLFSSCLPWVSIHSKTTSLGRKGNQPLSAVNHICLSRLKSRCLPASLFPFLPLILCLLQQKVLRWGNALEHFAFIPVSFNHLSHFSAEKRCRALHWSQFLHSSLNSGTHWPTHRAQPSSKACHCSSQVLACKVIFGPKNNFSDNEYNVKKLYDRSSRLFFFS